jgi:glycosyltransferase involved in cell wall biosynthesis
MKKIAYVYIAHDGFTTLYTGVGTNTRFFTRCFRNATQEFKKNNTEFEIDTHLVTIKYTDQCYGYKQEIVDELQGYIKNNKNVYFSEIINGSLGEISYGTIENWKIASSSAAQFLIDLANNYDKVVAIVVDTPFAGVINYLQQSNNEKISVFWLPQSTVKIHKVDSAVREKGIGDEYEKIRFDWEKQVIDIVNHSSSSRFKIAYIGEYMKNHLIEDYGAMSTNMIPIYNGICTEILDTYKKDDKYIENYLKTRNIPLGKKLVISWGRAEKYKGYDLLIKAFLQIKDKIEHNLVIIAAPYPNAHEYIDELKALIKGSEDRIQLFDTFEYELPYLLVQWENTEIASSLSRGEPCSLLQGEARYLANKNMVFLASNIGGFLYQIDDGVNGFLVNLEIDDISQKIYQVLNLSMGEKNKISDNGVELVSGKFNLDGIYLEFIKNTIC